MWIMEIFPRLLVLVIVTAVIARFLFIFRPFVEKKLKQVLKFINKRNKVQK